VPIRVVLAEDSYLVREGIVRLLGTQPDLEVVGACGDLDALYALVEAEHPDVVLTDIRMPPGETDEGIQAAVRLRETHPDAVADGGSLIDPEVIDALVTSSASRESSPLDELTPREHDVLREMAAGKNNAAIAATLFLSERSVEKVIHAIFLKLGIAWESTVHKRVKAVVLYLAETG